MYEAMTRGHDLLVTTRCNDFIVKFFRRIEIVIIRRQASIRELIRLLCIQHPKCTAGLHAQFTYTFHHINHTIKCAAIHDARPCTPHTKTRRTSLFRLARLHQNLISFHQHFFFKIGVIMNGLRTIFAIFRTAPRLNGKQRTHLHLAWVMVCAVNGCGLMNKVKKRHVV